MNTDNIIIISDVDGILTDGKFYYSEKGKILKQFGRDDNDAIKILKKILPNVKLLFVSSDKHGFEITKKRIIDMDSELEFVSVQDRLNLIKKYQKDHYVVYIGDSFVDIPVLSQADFSCTVNNVDTLVKQQCNFVSKKDGSDGGFADCILNIIQIFTNQDIGQIIKKYFLEKPL